MTLRVFGAATVASDPQVFQVGEQKKNKGEFRVFDGKSYISVVAWEGLANDLPANGEKVLIEGRISTRSYEKDGRKVYVTEVVASSIEKLGTPAPEPEVDLDFG